MASNSTQIIADLQTVFAVVPLATQVARANAAAGPIMDIGGNLDLLIDHAQEMRQIMCYLLEASQVSTSLTAPAGGIFQTGDSNAATTYNLLVGIYQILK